MNSTLVQNQTTAFDASIVRGFKTAGMGVWIFRDMLGVAEVDELAASLLGLEPGMGSAPLSTIMMALHVEDRRGTLLALSRPGRFNRAIRVVAAGRRARELCLYGWRSPSLSDRKNGEAQGVIYEAAIEKPEMDPHRDARWLKSGE